MAAWGVEAKGNPPTRRKDSLGVENAGVGEGSLQRVVGGPWGRCRGQGDEGTTQRAISTRWGTLGPAWGLETKGNRPTGCGW